MPVGAIWQALFGLAMLEKYFANRVREVCGFPRDFDGLLRDKESFPWLCRFVMRQRKVSETRGSVLY